MSWTCPLCGYSAPVGMRNPVSVHVCNRGIAILPPEGIYPYRHLLNNLGCRFIMGPPKVWHVPMDRLPELPPELRVRCCR